MKKFIFTLFVVLLSIGVKAAYSGKCGDNLTWTFQESTGVLKISGTGIMSFSGEPAPWSDYSSKILKVEIGDDITNIEHGAFQDCINLTSVSLSNGIINIGGYAFYGCINLSEVELPQSIKIVDEFAFGNCAFRNLHVPASLTEIGDGAFAVACGLLHISVDENNPVYDDGGYSNGIFETTTNTLVTGGINTIIPETITIIGNNAFQNCTDMTSIDLHDNITQIGKGAFGYCSNLKSIALPDSLKFIDQVAFCYSGLTSVTTPEKMDSIAWLAFHNCKNLTDVALNSRAICANGLFGGCSELKSIIIGADVKYINSSGNFFDRLFGNNTSPQNVKILVDKNNTVYDSRENCNGIIETETNTLIQGYDMTIIPKSITRIGHAAFKGCNSITSICIPENISELGEHAFSNCNGLDNVKVLAKTPPTAYDNTFSNYDIELCVLEKSIDAYQTTNPWSKFKTFKKIADEDTEIELCATPTISYINGELVFESETEGVVFHSTITDTDINSYETNKVQLNVTYNISVYATKADYKDSEVAKATLCWIDVEPKSEGLTNTDIANVKALPVVVQANNGTITVSGADDGTLVEVYGISGTKLGEAKTTLNKATIHTDAQTGSVVIVKVGNKSIKVAL